MEKRAKIAGKIYGFPLQKGIGAIPRLKVDVLEKEQRNAITYIGIAADEKKRFGILSEFKRSPLVEYGWTEEMCRNWCSANGLLSPIYELRCAAGAGFAIIKEWSNCVASKSVSGILGITFKMGRRQPCDIQGEWTHGSRL